MHQLILLTLAHTLVDTFAIIIEPLWVVLEQQFELGESGLFWLLTIPAVTPSFSQIVFGYVRDRYDLRYVLWVGPLLAAASLPLIGKSAGFGILCVLLVVGYTSIGAFHPEAAVTAGRIFPHQRARCLAIFMFGGTFGLALGPMLSGNLVARYGIGILSWLAVPGVLLALLLSLFFHATKVHGPSKQDVKPDSLNDMLQGRGRWACFLLLVGALRTVPNIGMAKAIAFTLDSRDYQPDSIGNTQSLFLFSGSMGMLLMASMFRQGMERRFLFWCPLAGIPTLVGLGLPESPYWLMLVLLVPTGLVLIGTMPAMVSYAHQLLPKGAGMASAVAMGLSWGVGGIIVSKLTTYYVKVGRPQMLFHAFIPCLLLSAIAAYFLPAIETKSEMTSKSIPQGQPGTAESRGG